MRKSKSLVNIFDALIYNGLRSHLPARSYMGVRCERRRSRVRQPLGAMSNTLVDLEGLPHHQHWLLVNSHGLVTNRLEIWKYFV